MGAKNQSTQSKLAKRCWRGMMRARQIFSTRVVNALHHDEKMQTLFDIEMEDCRRFTDNNNHPVYAVEDDEFILTRELAARFAKGEPVTFLDVKNQPIKIVNVQMRRERCKVYNLQVDGLDKNG